jgi:WD40 repeat protein
LLNSFQAHTDDITRIKQSPFNDGIYVATASSDKTIKIWDASNWNLIQTYKNHSKSVHALEFINEDTIVTGGFDNTIQIWIICTGITNRTIYTTNNVHSLQLMSNSFDLLAGLGNGYINIYNIYTGSFISTLKGHSEWVFDLVLLSNQNLLASSSGDNSTRIWDLTTYTLKYNLTGHTSWVRGLKLVSTEILASGSWDYTIKLWNITDGTLIRTLSEHTNKISWSVDLFNSYILVSGSYDRKIKLWNITTGSCLKTTDTGTSIGALAVLKLTITSK